ncbi:MAG: SnoaL-like domain [bacterium]|jgi:ketosteroid isomerase-like protein|nr:SnoaL-like domain [Solirubrobacteraceae bacterium]
MSDDPVEYIRRLWRTLERHGLEAMLELTPADVVWEPLGAGGRPLRTHDELRAYFAAMGREGRSQEATFHTFEAVGSCVLVIGGLRHFDPGGFSDSQPSWVYVFEEGRLVRAVGYDTEAEARAAIAAGL